MAHKRSVAALGIYEVTNKHQLVIWLRRRDGNNCKLCGKPIIRKTGFWGPSIDHVLPLSKGGLHVVTNIQLAHTWCNNRKGNGDLNGKASR